MQSTKLSRREIREGWEGNKSGLLSGAPEIVEELSSKFSPSFM